MGHENLCNTGLVLGLGCETRPENQSNLDHPPRNQVGKIDRLLSMSLEPSLTLGLADGGYNEIDVNKANNDNSDILQNSNHDHTGVKRERDLGAEDVELERVSSRVSDEDEEGNSRKKLRLTKEQSGLLEDSFKEHSTLNPKQKQDLARKLNLRPRQVEVWFQNRRARTKLKQTEVDCEFLKRCCETLTDENRRLHKELQELKALKFSSPLYMQLSAATLTMCPSCERIGGTGGTSIADNTASRGAYTMAAKSHHYYGPFTHSSAAC